MDFRGYVAVLRRSLVLITLSVIALVGVAYAITQQMTPVYESKARVLASSAQTETTEAYAGGLLSQQRVRGYAVLVDSRLLAERVKSDLGLEDSIEDLSESVLAAVVEDTPVLELIVNDDDPERARLIAQTYAENLVETAGEIETPPEGKPLIKLTVIDPASYSDGPVSPQPLRNLVVGLLAGILIGVSIALVRELLDTSITTSGDIEELTDAPLLATIAKESGAGGRQLVTELDPHAPRVESFRVMRTNIQFLEVDSIHKVFVVTSSLQGEGKTSTAINLALTLSRAGVSTLLVDGDLRRPRVAEILNLDGSVGVTTVLLGKVGLREAVQQPADGYLDVLTSGTSPPNASELLQSRAMGALLDAMRATYEVVIFDSPPLLPVTDAALLAARSDGAIIVVKHKSTTKDQLAIALDRLTQVDSVPVGVVLNMAPLGRTILGRTYGYGAYGAYGAYMDKQKKNSRGKRQNR